MVFFVIFLFAYVLISVVSFFSSIHTGIVLTFISNLLEKRKQQKLEQKWKEKREERFAQVKSGLDGDWQCPWCKTLTGAKQYGIYNINREFKCTICNREFSKKTRI